MEAPGWVEVKPLEEFPELTCEIKRLSFTEMLDFKDEHSDDEGTVKLRFGSKEGRGVFKAFVQNIKNLECAGRKIKQPWDLFSDNMPPDDGAHHFLIMCVKAWWDMNMVSEDESLDLNEPSVSIGSEAAEEVIETPV